MSPECKTVGNDGLPILFIVHFDTWSEEAKILTAILTKNSALSATHQVAYSRDMHFGDDRFPSLGLILARAPDPADPENT